MSPQNWPPTGIEDWHVVGGTGEPAFQNSWVNTAGEAPASFFRDPYGIVHLRGRIQGGANNTVAFTLPAGYRPGYNQMLAAAVYSGSTPIAGFVYLQTSGVLNMFFQAGAASIAIDGITFRAEQ